MWLILIDIIEKGKGEWIYCVHANLAWYYDSPAIASIVQYLAVSTQIKTFADEKVRSRNGEVQHFADPLQLTLRSRSDLFVAFSHHSLVSGLLVKYL